jgi:hypothetical protein
MKNRETETSTPQRLNISALWKYGGGREASKRLSFVECHGLSVTRSKAAAGRQNEAAALPTAVGDDRWRGESLARCFASGRETSSLPAQSSFQYIPPYPDVGLRCLRGRAGNKTYPVKAPGWRRRRKNSLMHLFSIPR